MSKHLFKTTALWGISKGLRLPQASLDRVSELIFLKKLLTQLAIDCVVDVGANRGQYARELRGIGYADLIVSFEPVDSEYQVMKEHFDHDPNWRGVNAALGSREESMCINIPKLTVMSSLLESTMTSEDSRQQVVRIQRLDKVLPKLLKEFGKTRVFLKMDTQGYDLEVFKGATECMHCIEGIESELSIQPLYKNMPHYLTALETYESAGFKLYNLSVVNRISDGGLLELNCFMRRA